MEKLKILVTGTGKSGTLFMANMLTSMDFPCGHEAIFTEFGIEEAKLRLSDKSKIKFSDCSKNELGGDWTEPKRIVADSSYLAAPFLNDELLFDTKIIHVVRNPIDVISSFVLFGGYFDNYWLDHTINFQNFIRSNCPIVYDNNFNNVTRAAIFYIEWNRIIEERSNKNNYFFYKLEDDITKLANFLNKSKFDSNLGTKINCWNKTNRKVKLEEIATPIRYELIELSKKYDYKIINKFL